MKNNLYIILTSFVLGALFAVSVYQAVTIYKFRALVNNDHVTLTQVVNFLNSQLQAAQNNKTKEAQSDNSGNPNVLFQSNTQ